jgi:hypothetical protein
MGERETELGAGKQGLGIGDWRLEISERSRQLACYIPSKKHTSSSRVNPASLNSAIRVPFACRDCAGARRRGVVKPGGKK